jgi:hypothetical protein
VFHAEISELDLNLFTGDPCDK